MARIPNPHAVRNARKAVHLTQDELAKDVGLRRETISRLERGNARAVGLGSLSRIARICGVPRDTLLMDVPEEELANPLATTPDERELLRRYRRMSLGQQIALIGHAFLQTEPLDQYQFERKLGQNIISAESSASDVDVLKKVREAYEYALTHPRGRSPDAPPSRSRIADDVTEHQGRKQRKKETG